MSTYFPLVGWVADIVGRGWRPRISIIGSKGGWRGCPGRVMGFWSDEGGWEGTPSAAGSGRGDGFGFRLRRRALARAADDDDDDAKSESRRYHSTTTTTTTKFTYRFRTTTTARLFSTSPPQQLSAVNFPVPGGGYTICLSESTGRQARATNTQISIPLWTAAAADPGHWDEAEDKCSGTAAHTHRRFICTGLGCEEGGAGSGDMMASGRPAIRDIFPARPSAAAAPVAFVDVFVSCVGGCAFLPSRQRWCRFPGQPENHKQSSQSVCWAAARRLVGGRRFACVCVCYPAPEGCDNNCPAGHGWRGGGGGTGVYGYGALFLCCGCEAGSYEITSRGE